MNAATFLKNVAAISKMAVRLEIPLEQIEEAVNPLMVLFQPERLTRALAFNWFQALFEM